MKKTICFFLILMLFVLCKPKQEDVERIIENGVEVVLNHLEPYRIKGETSNLILKEQFTIDTEKDEIVALGLSDISGFDVDSEGNIYLRNRPDSTEKHFFKFDNAGRFTASFGSNGQGPGEFEWAWLPRISQADEIFVSDIFQRKLVVFDTNCSLVREIPITMEISEIYPLIDGKCLIVRRIRDVTRKTDPHSIGLFSYDLKEIKELDKYIFTGSGAEKRDSTRPYIFTLSMTRNYIYIGNVERGYEISVFGMEGKLIKKIRKEYKPVEVTEEYMKDFLDMTPERIRKRIYFQKYWPPFQYLFTDDKGYLFVMTFEKGENLNDYLYDIFNPNGIFIGRTVIDNYGYRQYISKNAALDVMAKQDRIYYIREKESGYKELVVYRMKWE